MEEVRAKSTPNATCLRLTRQLNWWRALQMLITLVIFILATYLAAYIGDHALGLAGGLPTTSVMSGLSFLTTLLTSWCMRHFGGYYTRGCVITFLFFDFFCTFLQVATLIVLGAAGVPWNCKGLTNNSYGASDTPDNPSPGYSTVRFGNGTTSGRGMLDHYCPIPIACFWQSVALLIFYPWTIGLSIRLVVALYRKRKADKELALEHIELEGGNRPAPVVIDVTPGSPQEMPDTLSQATELPSPLSTTVGSPLSDERHYLEATISNGSWVSGSERREENDPPPYQPDQKPLPKPSSR